MSSYLFIDGAYLRKHFTEQMRSFYGVVPEIDFEVLAASLKSERTYYYDAIDYERHATESEETSAARVAMAEAIHDYINNLPGFHVREGHVRRSPKRRNREQKAVDVQLAVDALEHAARGNIKLMTREQCQDREHRRRSDGVNFLPPSVLIAHGTHDLRVS